MKKAKLIFCFLFVLIGMTSFAQNVRVKGTVKDAATDEPIPFASVQIKGTHVGAASDVEGVFTISAAPNATLIVSSIGYHTVEVIVDGKSNIEIALRPDTEALDDVIVVAYGTSTKSSFTGSAAMVKEEVIEKKITTNVTSALAGSAPGVQVITSSGDPTSNSPSIRIRGIGSMSASNAPLIVVDGVPFDGAMSDINPQDVENMSVLKDASASAIYGHRGANGVILITTKKGKSGEAQVKFDARLGVNSRLIPQYDVITDPAQYYEVWYKKLFNKEYYANGDAAAAYAKADANLLDQNNGGLGYQVFTVPDGQLLVGRDFKINPVSALGYYNGAYYYKPDNWYKEAFHNGFRQEYNMSVSGSSNRFSYYASAGFLNDGGMVDNSNYKRYTGRINAEYQAKDWLRFITNTTFSHSDSQIPQYSTTTWGSSGSVFYITNNIAPIYPLYVRKRDENGHPYIVMENGRKLYDANSTTDANGNSVLRAGTSGNAVRDNIYNDEHQYADVLVGKWGVIATPIAGLSLSANIGVTADNTRYTYLGSKYGSSANTDGYAYAEHSRMFTVNKQLLAEYKFTLGFAHNFDILAGYESFSRRVQHISGQNDHLYDPFIGELNNADGHSNEYANSYTDVYITDGFLSRFQYDYDGRYFLSASLRRDESSFFAPGHRWGTFGSLGAAWLVSKEAFMSDVDWVDLFKVKFSYGVQGNDNLGNYYPYANQYTHNYNENTGEYSIALSRVGNENLTWETSHALNGGFDFELFHGALNGTLEVFSRTTTDLLYNQDVPYSSGNPLSYIPTNVGSINNLGFDLDLNGNIINTKDVQWSWNANFSHYRNKILSLDESVAKDGIKFTGGIYSVGGSLYEGYMYKFAGVDEATGKGLYYKKIYDVDEDDNPYWTGEEEITDNFAELTNSSSHDDRYKLGSFLPKLFGGFGTSLNAYGFDFSVQCSYQLGGRYYDGTYQALMHTQDNAGQNIHKDILLAWTPENTQTNVPRWDGDIMVAQTPVDRFVISSNYLSINNVTLGYTIPAYKVNKYGIAALRLYVAGENLYVFSARKGLDPRFAIGIGSMTANTGLGSGSYGAMRNITGGITLTF
ncbi:MAG: SusC/RagA family TonB-linked outer membrane protein [Bacteroidales bacterium]|nr:SusC/RagA family TonB-linked outer membrane protein [Bacteroidales bacterium]